MNNFNDSLLSLIETNKERERIKSNYENKKSRFQEVVEKHENIEKGFIEELAIQFRKECATLLEVILKDDSQFLKKLFESSQYPPQTLAEHEKFVAKYEQVKKISDSELDSLDSYSNYSYFIYLIDFILNPIYIKSTLNWLDRAANKYPKSGILKFLHGYAIDVASNFFEIRPEQDAGELISDSVKMDSESVIGAQEKYLSIIKEYRKEHPELYKLQYELLGKVLFPNLNQSQTSYTKALISFYLSKIASYYRRTGQKEKSEDRIEKAIKLYHDNSAVLIQMAHLEAKENSPKAIVDFKRALELVENQFCNLPLQIYVKIGAYSGIAYTYYNQGLYKNAEPYYYKILDALEYLKQRFPISESREAVVLLNRSRNRLDKEDFIGAWEDLTKIKELTSHSMLPDHLLADMHNNLGLIYLKEGVYENADSEFHKAIELNPKLEHAYYNLGKLYYDQGNIERAKKLIQTSVKINPNYKEGRETLTNLEKAEIEGIGDWWKWWFKSETDPRKMRLKGWISAKRIIGALLAMQFIILVSIVIYNLMENKDVSNSVLGVLAIIIVILILPFIKKIEAGPVKFEADSKGERPLVS